VRMTQDTLEGGITRIALEGQLDLQGAQSLEQPFAFATTTRAGRFVIDMTGVTFVASIGIRMLVTSARAQSQRGGKMVIIEPPGRGAEVLRMAGIDRLIPFVPDLDAALAALGDAA
jgi:anti-sigma B factor antagonist